MTLSIHKRNIFFSLKMRLLNVVHLRTWFGCLGVFAIVIILYSVDVVHESSSRKFWLSNNTLIYSLEQQNSKPRVREKYTQNYFSMSAKSYPNAKTSETSTLYEVKELSCAKIFNGNSKEINKSKQLSPWRLKKLLQPEYYLQLSQNCEAFKKSRGYITGPVSKKEENFPIAFSIMTYRDFEQTERLLRAIYRPHNIYCIHVDAKSSLELKVLSAVAKCFDNVHMASRQVYVGWNNFTSLEADLICMRDLYTKRKKWKYFINLTGQEFPLRTNYELVQILEAFDGAIDIWGSRNYLKEKRWKRAGPIPHNLTMYKGSNHIIANRDFVDYALHNSTAQDLLEWHKNVAFPGESFFNILNCNYQLGIPGSYTGKDNLLRATDFVARYKFWHHRGAIKRFGYRDDIECHGKYVRGICIISTGDLKTLGVSEKMFINKFHLKYEPYALDCMEEWYFNRTGSEYSSKSVLNTTFYKSLEFVKHSVKKKEVASRV